MNEVTSVMQDQSADVDGKNIIVMLNVYAFWSVNCAYFRPV